MQFDKGYLSPYMATDTEKMEAILDNPYILLTDKKISNVQEILPLLEAIMQESGKLLIICDDIEGEALSTLILNKLRGVLNVVAVKAPGFGDKRKAMLEDVCLRVRIERHNNRPIRKSETSKSTKRKHNNSRWKWKQTANCR